MQKEYYVIVNLDTLEYMNNGIGTKIDSADKFSTLQEVKEELKTYDDDFNGAIYKIKEKIEYEISKIEDC